MIFISVVKYKNKINVTPKRAVNRIIRLTHERAAIALLFKSNSVNVKQYNIRIIMDFRVNLVLVAPWNLDCMVGRVFVYV